MSMFFLPSASLVIGRRGRKIQCPHNYLSYLFKLELGSLKMEEDALFVNVSAQFGA